MLLKRPKNKWAEKNSCKNENATMGSRLSTTTTTSSTTSPSTTTVSPVSCRGRRGRAGQAGSWGWRNQRGWSGHSCFRVSQGRDRGRGGGRGRGRCRGWKGHLAQQLLHCTGPLPACDAPSVKIIPSARIKNRHCTHCGQYSNKFHTFIGTLRIISRAGVVEEEKIEYRPGAT